MDETHTELAAITVPEPLPRDYEPRAPGPSYETDHRRTLELAAVE